MIDLAKIVAEQLPKIPPQVREYLESDAYPKVMRELILKYKLHVDTTSQIELNTTLLLIGILPPAEYRQSLIEDAESPETLANQIVSEMNEQIFKPLLETYKKPAPAPAVNPFANEVAVQKSKETEEVETETPTQIPVATPIEEKKIEKKYAIDPYREPIE